MCEIKRLVDIRSLLRFHTSLVSPLETTIIDVSVVTNNYFVLVRFM
jgi:hypothetical protein